MDKCKPKKSYIIDAVCVENRFKNFGIFEATAPLYGCSVNDIIPVEITIAEDQTIPTHNEDINSDEYWAWFDYEDKRLKLIQPSRFQLNMCFPSGIKSREDIGKGKAYKINVKKY